ncbi:MAG: BRCT domain-containing protein [Pirellulales bacterium]
MAKKKASAVQALTIALIIFVMCTFVLAVTTYVFYAQNEDAKVAKEAAEDAATEARQSLTTAEQAQKDLLEARIGVNPGDSIEAVDKELAGLQEKAKKYGGEENATPTYRELIKTFDSALKSANGDNASLTAENRDLQDKLKSSQKNLKDIQVSHSETMDEKQKEIDAIGKAREETAAKFTAESQKLTEDLNAANDKASRLADLEKQIHDEVGPYISPSRRDKFSAANNAADQVAIVLEELTIRDKLINQQNQVLGAMRVADPTLQRYILAATPADDRIDGFDGRVVVVNERERSVLVRFPRTIGIRPGMLFFAYEPMEQMPLISAKKGILEIVSVESGTVARGRILNTSNYNPIVEGDAVATSLWSPLMPLEVVFVGHIQIDRDSATDDQELEDLIQKVGGDVAQTVSHTTSLLVDAGVPNQSGVSGENLGWDEAAKRRRTINLQQANKLGIKVVRIDGFLELFGLEENYFDADHLVTPTP